MKINLSDQTSRFAKRTLADFSEKMIVMLADMPLEEISVRKICDVCNYERYGYRKISEFSGRTKHRTDIFAAV